MPDDPSLGDWEKCRDYLRVLARQGLGSQLRGKIDESDLVQDALLQAYRTRDQFRGRTTNERLAWLRQILFSKLCDAHRRYRRGKRDATRERSIHDRLEKSSVYLVEQLCAVESSPSEQAAKREGVLLVAAALQNLPVRQREAVELHYLQSCSFSEVAEQMGLNRNQVAGLIRRGLAELRRTT